MLTKRAFRGRLIAIGIAVITVAVTSTWERFASSETNPADSVNKTVERKVSVQVIKPIVRDLDIKLKYPVNIQAIYQANILPTEVSGYLTEINVDKGDYVRKGQLLATIDPSEENEKVKQAEEAVRQAEAAQKNADLTLQRYLEMRRQDFVSQQDVDNAELAFEVAQTNLEKSKSDLQGRKVHLQYTQLTAPFSGYVTMRYLDPGAMVAPASAPPILTLMKIDTVRIQVNVAEQDTHYIRSHLKAEFTVDAFPSLVFHGEVTRFAHAVDPLSRTLLVEIDIPNPDLKLKPGMYGRLDLIVDRHPKSIILPAEAVLVQESGASVFTVVDGVVKRIPVTLGYDGGDFLEVAGGLTGQETIILSGQDEVTNGTPVEATRVAPPLDAASSQPPSPESSYSTALLP
ncbi:MAG TPA: efflux RND transporter periplasmic adaptor subunit [Nitrospiria bacterium]|nr:efflux RND transporter periplasmic adaptor subunit [Nitrospiria bacterium]